MDHRIDDLVKQLSRADRQLAAFGRDDFATTHLLQPIGGYAALKQTLSASQRALGEYESEIAWAAREFSLAAQLAERDWTGTQRLAEAMRDSGLFGLNDDALRSVYGDFSVAGIDRRALFGPIDEMIAATAARFSQEHQRQAWLEHLLPTVDLVHDLGIATWDQTPFGSYTESLLEDVLGDRSFDAIEALGRASGLRQRRGLYRELGAEPEVESLPAYVIDAAFSPRETASPAPARQAPFLVQLQRTSPLTKWHARCYEIIGAFEFFLRRSLNAYMTQRHGLQWTDVIGSDMRSKWRRGFRRHYGNEDGATSEALLQFADLADVVILMRDHCADAPWDIDGFQHRMSDVLMIRNQAAHYRALVPADYVALKTAVNEIGNALDAFL